MTISDTPNQKTDLMAPNMAVDQSLASLTKRLPDGAWCRMLTPDDAQALRDFRADIVAHLDDPDHYRMAGEVGDFVADHLGPKGVTAAVFAPDGTMIAYGALGLPRPGDANRGADLGLPKPDLGLVAHVSSAMIQRGWRDMGIHHALIDWRIDLAGRLGKRHLLTTVSPRNHQSWGHLAAHGLIGKRLINVGGDLIRVLVHRDLNETPRPLKGSAVMVPIEALAGETARFAAGHWLWRRERRGDGTVWGELALPAPDGAVAAQGSRSREQPAC